MSTCKHGSTAPDQIIAALHESQAGQRAGVEIWRHKCCDCAFARGEELGRMQTFPPGGNAECKVTGRRVPFDLMDSLPKSQAGSGRHQCAICAFHEGFGFARSQASEGREIPYKGFGDGSKKYQKWARLALPLLVAQAKARHTITYGQLALEMDMPNPRNLNVVLGAVGLELKNLGREWHEEIPPLTCLVVNKHEKTPQRGIQFHMPPEEFEKLSPSGQEELLHHLNRDIWDYPRWVDVLHYFDLEPVAPAKSKALQAIAKEAKYGRAGGETEDHRRLKEYVKGNPQLIGLSKSLCGEIEYPFASGDELDVLFKCGRNWVGVEVKSARSDTPDIMRGIFQCVKYKALIEATQRYEQVDVGSRVVLVLGGTLPPELRRVVGLLKIELVEKVRVPDSF